MPTSSVGRTSASSPLSSSRRGFTLLELLVVMVIAGLLAGLIGPRLSGSLGRTELRTAAKKIAASLRYARSLAVSHNVTYAGRFDLDQRRILVGRIYRDAAQGGAESLMEPRIYRLPRNIRMEIPQREAMDPLLLFDIRFYPAGNASGGRILLMDDDNRRQILTVDFITGTVAVEG